MDEMLQGNSGTNPAEKTSLTQRGLDIVDLVEQSDDYQAIELEHNDIENIDTEEHDIPVIELTSDAIID